jgi:DNA-binding winged helix-turn-helix (wHTH) protein/TolB-like protein
MERLTLAEEIISSNKQARKIGEWRVDPSINEIRRGGDAVRLEPKAMEVLTYLADRPGVVVSREELLSALWPGVVVGDDTLTQAVIKLRKALCDPARTPAYIETISKRGYRLVARVEPAENVVAVPPSRWPRRAGGAAIALAVMAAAVIAYHATRTGSAPPPAEALPVDEPIAERSTALPTVAVTPFEALGDDADRDYLARGITADLATDLSRLSGLRVVSVPKAARYVVSGSLQRASGKLRINARLIDNESGQQLWAERYEYSRGDPFVVNEELIGQLLAALSVQVGKAERHRLARRYTRNLEAYDYFLRGQGAYLARQQPENSMAREMYRKAIELDPAFGRAYGGLALTHAADYRDQWTAERRQALARAAELAETAVRIDPQLPDVYAVLGYVRSLQGQHAQAIAHLKQAIALDRFYADAYAHLGAIYTHVGQPARTVPLLRAAMRLNPDAGFIYFLVLGRAYLFQGDLEQALINLREALARNAADLEARVFMAASLAAAGDLEAAKWETEVIRSSRPDFSARRWLETHPMTNADQRQRLIQLLAQIGL